MLPSRRKTDPRNKKIDLIDFTAIFQKHIYENYRCLDVKIATLPRLQVTTSKASSRSQTK